MKSVITGDSSILNKTIYTNDYTALVKLQDSLIYKNLASQRELLRTYSNNQTLQKKRKDSNPGPIIPKL